MYLFSSGYFLWVLVPTLLLTGWAAWRVRSTYGRWSKIDSGINLSATDFARRLLDRQGLTDVRIEPISGQLTDQYDPRGKVLRISDGVRADNRRRSASGVPGPLPTGPLLSVAAAAVIAHEVGHALQDRQRDPWMTARGVIVPAAQIGSNLGPWLVIGGLIFQIPGLAVVGLLAFGAAVVFTLVTLPVEIGASGRALAFVESLGMVGERQDGARAVLKAAAWTYVAAAMAAVLTFAYYALLVFGRRD